MNDNRYTRHPGLNNTYLRHTINPHARGGWTYCGVRLSDTHEMPEIPGMVIVQCRRCQEAMKERSQDVRHV